MARAHAISKEALQTAVTVIETATSGEKFDVLYYCPEYNCKPVGVLVKGATANTSTREAYGMDPQEQIPHCAHGQMAPSVLVQ